MGATHDTPANHTAAPAAVDFHPPAVPVNSRPLALLVLGMHRSGTSVLTRVLSLMGADLPSKLLPANDGNETGYWESEELSLLQEELLESVHLAWDHSAAFPQSWYETAAAVEFRRRVLEILRRDFGASRMFVLKDPRMSLLVPFWTGLLEEFGADPVFIISVRDPLEVAGSLAKRNQFIPQKSMLLWLRYMLDAQRATNGMRRCHVAYQDLLNDWRSVVETVSRKAAIDWPRSIAEASVEIDALVTDSLRHQRVEPGALDSDRTVNWWVKEAYAAALAAARGDDSTLVETNDRINAALETANLLFDPLMAEHHVATWKLWYQRGELSERAHEALVTAENLRAVAEQLETATAQLEEHRKAAERLGEQLVSKDAEVRRMTGELADHQSRIVGLLAQQEQSERQSLQAQAHAEQLRRELDKAGIALASVQGARDDAFTSREKTAASLGEALRSRDQAIASRDGAIASRNQALAARDKAQASRDEAHAARVQAEVARDAALRATEAARTERDAALAQRDKAFAVHDKGIAQRESRHERATAHERYSSTDRPARPGAVPTWRRWLGKRGPIAGETIEVDLGGFPPDKTAANQAGFGGIAPDAPVSADSPRPAPVGSGDGESKDSVVASGNEASEEVARSEAAASDPDASDDPIGEVEAGDLEAGDINRDELDPAINWLFNADYYLETNPDVACSGADPLTHFLKFGWKEWRVPHPMFDLSYYLEANPDVASSGVNPLFHFLTSGYAEGRNPNRLFDLQHYTAHNPDVVAYGMNLVVHYMQFGGHEGRNPGPLFDSKSYRDFNPEYRESGLDPLSHYLWRGIDDGLAPLPVSQLTVPQLSGRSLFALGAGADELEDQESSLSDELGMAKESDR